MADLFTSLQRVLQDEREVFGDFLVLDERPPRRERPAGPQAATPPGVQEPAADPVLPPAPAVSDAPMPDDVPPPEAYDGPPGDIHQTGAPLPTKQGRREQQEKDVKKPKTDAQRGDVNPAWVSAASLPALESCINMCMQCPLGQTRTKFVFGVGNPNARLMFVGEAPGADEDAQGEPFVGRAGQLLNKILAAINMKREEVYIANILKCRPPNNRTPIPDEVEACMPFLKKQIAVVKPQIIVCLGLTAAQNLLGISDSLGKLRGRQLTFENTPLVVTYHPAALLRNPNWKPAAWEDFQAVQKFLAEHAGDVKEGTSVG
jgi:uracil-DNA glycosylase